MRALVLSGGGSKGAYQVGVLRKWLYEDHIEYDAFCGVSVGAINSAFLAQYPTSTQKAWTGLADAWAAVTPKSVRKRWCPFGALSSLWKKSVYNSEPLQEWLNSALSPDRIAASGKKLRVLTVSWDTSRVHVATELDKNIVDRVVASSSFPVMLSPIKIAGEEWTDGGLRNITPLGEAIRMGADEIDVVMCSNPNILEPFDQKSAALPGRALRALEIMTSQIEESDLRICGYKNDLAELVPKYKKVKIRLVQPSGILVEDSLGFEQVDIQRMIATGYADACRLG